MPLPLLRQRPHEAQADGAITKIGLAPAAFGRRLGITPGAAAGYVQSAIPLPRAAICRGAVVAVVIDVLYPFPHVAAHVVQAPGIGLLGGDRVGRLAAVACRFCEPAIPADAVQIVAAAVFLLRPRAAGVFPFRFTRQAVLFPGLGVERLDECLGIVPVHLLHRAIVAAVAELAGVVAHECFPLALRDFGLAYCKGAADGYAVHGHFVWLALARAHVETPRRDHHHLGAVGAVLENFAGRHAGAAFFFCRRFALIFGVSLERDKRQYHQDNS